MINNSFYSNKDSYDEIDKGFCRFVERSNIKDSAFSISYLNSFRNVPAIKYTNSYNESFFVYMKNGSIEIEQGEYTPYPLGSIHDKSDNVDVLAHAINYGLGRDDIYYIMYGKEYPKEKVDDYGESLVSSYQDYYDHDR